MAEKCLQNKGIRHKMGNQSCIDDAIASNAWQIHMRTLPAIEQYRQVQPNDNYASA